MKEHGKVIKVEGNIAFVALAKNVACGYCHACDASGKEERVLKVVNTLQAKKGNSVVIGVSEWMMVKAAILMYMIPLALFVVAYLLGDGVARMVSTNTDTFILSGILTSVLALTAYYFFMKILDQRTREGLNGKPTILKIL